MDMLFSTGVAIYLKTISWENILKVVFLLRHWHIFSQESSSESVRYTKSYTNKLGNILYSDLETKS